MKSLFKYTLAVAACVIATQAAAQITFYENEDFQGRTFTTSLRVGNFERDGFDDGASSVIVDRDRWEVCEDARFDGNCVVLRRGRYPSLASMSLNDRVSSARVVSRNERIADDRYAPQPPMAYDARRRNNERLYEADVTSVRAAVGTPERRCWLEREQLSQERGPANVPAAIAGALVGGILGHQVGGGSGKDVATVAGVVAGGLIGGNYGRDNKQQAGAQSIERCSSTPSQAHPDYWDVTYNFRGQEHRIQVLAPPGRTVTVNSQGEPRT